MCMHTMHIGGTSYHLSSGSNILTLCSKPSNSLFSHSYFSNLLTVVVNIVPPHHTQTHHSRWNSSGERISTTQRPLPDNSQQSQERDIHAPGRIRTRNPIMQAAKDTRLRLRGHWDWLSPSLPLRNNTSVLYMYVQLHFLVWSVRVLWDSRSDVVQKSWGQ